MTSLLIPSKKLKRVHLQGVKFLTQVNPFPEVNEATEDTEKGQAICHTSSSTDNYFITQSLRKKRSSKDKKE